jgi:hypothetical protein
MSQSAVVGGCLCRALRYRVEGAPLVSAICHCLTCRKNASAPMLPFLTFSAERFVLTRGTATDFHSSPRRNSQLLRCMRITAQLSER